MLDKVQNYIILEQNQKIQKRTRWRKELSPIFTP